MKIKIRFDIFEQQKLLDTKVKLVRAFPWVCVVDIKCITEHKPFELEGHLFYITSFMRVKGTLWDYECKVISQEEWRDRQLKNILN